jgi:photosystem II stability/assembly factor-like uncharacterized protein
VRARVLCVLLGGCGEEVDPPTWTIAAELDESVGALLSVWGTSPADLRAVGGQIEGLGDPGVGAMVQRNGGAWDRVALPPDTPVLNWIHGAGGRTWAVGNAGAAVRSDDDGVTWTRDDAPVDVPLWGVFALGPDEAWAVGGDAFDFDGTAVIVRHVGGAWESVPMPAIDRQSQALFKVWASGSSDVHAVGLRGVILHHDGSAWAQVPSDTDADLISLWGTGPDEIVAVGGRDAGTIVRWDGSAWASAVIPGIPGLNGVWLDDDGRAVLAGNRGTLADLEASSLEPEILDTPPSFDVLHAAFGLEGERERYSVGGTLEGSPPWTGIVMELR